MPANTAARALVPITDAELDYIAQVAEAARKMLAARDLLRNYEAHSGRRRAALEHELSLAITAFLEVRSAAPARVAP